MKKFLSLLFIAFSITAFAQTTEDVKSDSVKLIKPVELPAGFTKQLDVVYTSGKNWQQKLDLYLPAQDGRKPTPAIINIHGGGWNHGSKESQSGFSTFFKMGYAVANIEYRMTGEATAPAAIEDARCALIYLIKNAKALNIDVNRIVIMGGSAGGHLALMAGLLGNDNKFDINCKGVENIKVAAIIDKYGIADLTASVNAGYGMKKDKSAIAWLGNYAADEKFIKSVSPINYVTKNSPPVFIVHGNADQRVAYQHSVDLNKKLVEAGVKTEFITVEGGGHGGFAKDKNSEINKAIAAWLTSLGLSDKK